MAIRKPLVINAGQIEQLQAGDALDIPSVVNGQVSVDFGSTPSDLASITVTGQAWVTASSRILPGIVDTTADHPSGEEQLIEGLLVTVHTLVPGVGFTISVHAPKQTTGVYKVNYVSFDEGAAAGGSAVGVIQPKNFLTNGCFRIRQRGTSFTNPNGIYTLDRWRFDYDGTGGTQILSAQQFFPITEGVSGGPRVVEKSADRFMRIARSVNPTSQTFARVGQRLRDSTVNGIRRFHGTFTLSFYARLFSGGAGGDFKIRIHQNYGTAGGASAPVTTEIIKVLTGSWAYYTHTFTLDHTGKTIGASEVSDDFLGIEFDIFPGNLATVDLSYIQLEEGGRASEFELRPYMFEAIRCKHYFQKSLNINTAVTIGAQPGYDSYKMPATIPASTAGLIFRETRFPVEMQDIPTVTLYSQSDAAAGAVRNVTSSLNRTGCVAAAITKTGFGYVDVDNTSAVALTDGHNLAWQWTAESEI